MAPATMRAVRFHGPENGLRVEELVRPEPGPGEVVVQVAACGLCGSDVHFLEGLPVPGGVPLVLGHEAAGVVESVGDGVVSAEPGDRVSLSLGSGCGKCPTCQAGHQTSCPHLVAPGLHVDGAFAEAVKVPEGCLVSVPEGVSAGAAAVATDCVATPFHALRCIGRLRAGERVAVIGAGGLGLQAVRLARHLGAEQVVAVDPSEAALERALAAGATAAIPTGPDEDAAAALQAAAGGGVELALECVGTTAAASTALHALIPGGRLVLVGIGMAPPPIDVPQALFAVWELSVHGAFASHVEDLEEVLRLEADGVLDIDGSITHRLSLGEVPGGLEMLRNHRHPPGRIVMEAPAPWAAP